MTKDNLNVVFRALRKMGLVARQNFLCCSTCACAELYDRLTDDKIGAVYYHQQDAARMREQGTLCIRYSGNEDNGECSQRVVGEIVVAALRARGFDPEWDGDPAKVIEVSVEGCQ
jgi:hypothetical protein